MQPLRTALVLGGGGARGMAHAGVLRVLEEGGIRPDLIVGTSAGAIVGGAYALNPNAAALESLLEDVLVHGPLADLERRFKALTEPAPHGWRGRMKDHVRQAKRMLLLNRQAMRHALVDGALLEELVRLAVSDASFEDLAIPFHAVAFDLATNRPVVFGGGDLDAALLASASIPGVFRPVHAGEQVLVDGCVLDGLPCAIARSLGADCVIAVDIGRGLGAGLPESAAGVQARVSDIRAAHLRECNRRVADIVLDPDVGDVLWMEVSRAPECCAAGECCARAALEGVRAAITRARRRSWPRRLFGRRSMPDTSAVIRRGDIHAVALEFSGP